MYSGKVTPRVSPIVKNDVLDYTRQLDFFLEYETYYVKFF